MTPEGTTIRIRERSFQEVLDLAFLVIRRYPLQLLAASLAGVAPFAVLNEALGVTRGPWHLQALAYLTEAPMAFSPVTLFLGQATFVARPSAGRIARDWLRSIPRMLGHSVLRLLLLGCVVTVGVVQVRMAYLWEIVLLERGSRESAFPRAAALHRGSADMLVGRWLSALAQGIVYWGVLGYALSTVRSALLGPFEMPPLDLEAALASPEAVVSAWLVLGYLAVVRFLSYLDLRIRREGWEVELALRWAASRLEEPAAPGGRAAPSAVRRS